LSRESLLLASSIISEQLLGRHFRKVQFDKILWQEAALRSVNELGLAMPIESIQLGDLPQDSGAFDHSEGDTEEP
jgi:hypothetical protein